MEGGGSWTKTTPPEERGAETKSEQLSSSTLRFEETCKKAAVALYDHPRAESHQYDREGRSKEVPKVAARAALARRPRARRLPHHPRRWGSWAALRTTQACCLGAARACCLHVGRMGPEAVASANPFQEVCLTYQLRVETPEQDALRMRAEAERLLACQRSLCAQIQGLKRGDPLAALRNAVLRLGCGRRSACGRGGCCNPGIPCSACQCRSVQDRRGPWRRRTPSAHRAAATCGMTSDHGGSPLHEMGGFARRPDRGKAPQTCDIEEGRRLGGLPPRARGRARAPAAARCGPGALPRGGGHGAVIWGCGSGVAQSAGAAGVRGGACAQRSTPQTLVAGGGLMTLAVPHGMRRCVGRR